MLRLPRSSHAMRSASDARLACHQDSATTATASGIRTMRRTPFIPAIEVSSTDCSAPPNTGQWMTAAYSMSGSRTSMAKTGCPVTLSCRSRRRRGVPASFQSRGSFSATLAGGSILAAPSATAPKVTLRPLAVWVMTLFCALHSEAGTFQRNAAAAISISRAVAPARRK